MYIRASTGETLKISKYRVFDVLYIVVLPVLGRNINVSLILKLQCNYLFKFLHMFRLYLGNIRNSFSLA
jgi:hypothetical protein